MLKEKHTWLIFITILLVINLFVGLYFLFFRYSKVGGKIVVDKLSPIDVAVSSTVKIIKPESPAYDLLFFGDLMLDRNVGKIIKQDKNGVNGLLIDMPTDFFINHDIVGANLEGAVTVGGKHAAPINSYDFAFAPELVKVFKDNYNFNFFDISNNHVTDQGVAGFKETQQNLEDLSLNFVGCPDKQVGDCSVKFIKVNGKTIGVAGFSMVYGVFPVSEALEKIKSLASSTDMVIVNVHWGTEYEHRFSKVQQNLAHKIIDAGASAVIGHHPHVVQGMEIYNNHPIFYSLGNFIFDQYFSTDTQEELAVNLKYQNKVWQIVLTPLSSNRSHISIMGEQAKKKFLQKFVSWSNLNEDFKSQALNGTITVKQ